MNPEVRAIIMSMTPIVKYNWLDQLRPATGKTVSFYGHDVVDHELVEMLESPFNRSQK